MKRIKLIKPTKYSISYLNGKDVIILSVIIDDKSYRYKELVYKLIHSYKPAILESIYQKRWLRTKINSNHKYSLKDIKVINNMIYNVQER